jgi:hypothetical protein
MQRNFLRGGAPLATHKNGLLALTLLLASTPSWSQISYLRCEVQTTFHKPSLHGTEWLHAENHYIKYFRLDAARQMVAVYDWRPDVYKPICSDTNAACVRHWDATGIHLDARAAADSPVAPFLDFRRAIDLSDQLRHVQFVIADYGDAARGAGPMSWNYEGSCQPSAPPVRPLPGRGGPGATRAPTNPKYEQPTGPALAVSTEEADQALAGYYGNTMWGFSGGGHWFHMWFLDGSLAYTSDDEDISSEGTPRRWYVGKDSTGYRLCGEPIPATGKSGCYPLPQHRVGDSWVQHDMDGDAQFSLLPGRQ